MADRSIEAGLAAHKKALRRELRARREASALKAPWSGAALRDIFLARFPALPPRAFSTYIAGGGEMDPVFLEEALLPQGHLFCLPCVVAKGEPLLFRRFIAGDALRAGALGLCEPLPDKPVLEPDWLFVPLLGFDRGGYRLGQGGGYYDRTLASLRDRRKIFAVGLAYAEQEVDAVPRDEHDAPLDLIVTERGIIDPVSSHRPLTPWS